MTKATSTIEVNGKEVHRGYVVHHMKMMEQQKERVDALLLTIRDYLELGTHGHTLAVLAKEIQEDHSDWYELRRILGIDADLREGESDE